MQSTLQRNATAEGVETQDQLAALRRLGCEEVQGFYLAHPLTPAQLIEALSAGSPLGERIRLVTEPAP